MGGREKQPIKIGAWLLARNTVLNFIGQVVPLLVGVITIPCVVRGIGTERFGLLSLAWAILGYFSIFDLGLGRATTKFVAEALGKGEEDQIPRIIWTAVTVQTILGIVGAVVLVGISPLLIDHFLKIPSELVGEAKIICYLLALAIPVVLISGSFRGVLEASQRFELVNAVSIPVGVLTYICPLLGLVLGMNLPGMVALILLARAGALAAFVALNLFILPGLRKYSGSLSFFPRLFSFGGWVTISSVLGPILVYLDRFLIGSLLSMSAVAYYSAPYEVVTRLWIIPASFTATLFPAFSALKGDITINRHALEMLFSRAIKYILLIMGPIVLAAALFSKEILQFWLGEDFAVQSSLAFSILAIGILVNSLGWVAYSLIQGMGRPDITAKIHLAELPVYIGIAWFFIKQAGIVGAAIACTTRLTLDAVLMFTAAFKITRFSPCALKSHGLISAGVTLALLAIITHVIKKFMYIFPWFLELLLFGGLLGLFLITVWKKVLDSFDREFFLRISKLRAGWKSICIRKRRGKL